jgi:AcrR family transcriptional regulator
MSIPRRGLTIAAIVKAALDVADAEGFETVSMRRVAAKLGVGAMTLYSYVDSKDDLLTHVFDEVMGELLVPEPLPGDWREALTAISRRTRDVWLEHPWLAASIGARSEFGPRAMRHVEQSLEAVAPLGLGGPESMQVIAVVDDYVMGYTLRRVASGQAFSTADAADDWRATMEERFRAALDSGAFPRLAELARSEWSWLGRDRFETGLALLLDGIEARYAG